MKDLRDEALGAALERVGRTIEADPPDRLGEVLQRGGRLRVARFTSMVVAVAIFAGAVAWAGVSIREGGTTIPADIDHWRTFASLEDNGWTIQVPPPWHVTELPACPGAPERIGMVAANVEFWFRAPDGGAPDCGDRFVLAGFPEDGVALTFTPIVGDSLPGSFGQLPDTVLPLSPDLLVVPGGIRGGPKESFQSVWLHRNWIGTVRLYVGPQADAGDIRAVDQMLASLRVRGAPRWVESRARSLGDIRMSFVRPDTWSFAGYPQMIVIDAPTPILRLRSPGIGDPGCELPGMPWIQVGRFDEFGVEIVVSDGRESFAQPDLRPRPDRIGFDDLGQRWVRCRGKRLKVSSVQFEDSGIPISVDVIATDAVYREQPEMLLYILNSIEISKV